MREIRSAAQRGTMENDWLFARFSFCFGPYHDPHRVRWGPLRALNEDLVAAGKGFGAHPHQDIETITYPLTGQIEHRDNIGNHHIIGRGQVQRMSAGTGIVHSEMNASSQTPEMHLQIWLLPQRAGGAPECELRDIPDDEKRGRWRIIASPDGREGSVTVRQDANLYARIMEPGEAASWTFAAGRVGYVHVIEGVLQLEDGSELGEGDGLALREEASLGLQAGRRTELLLFDMVDG